MKCSFKKLLIKISLWLLALFPPFRIKVLGWEFNCAPIQLDYSFHQIFKLKKKMDGWKIFINISYCDLWIHLPLHNHFCVILLKFYLVILLMYFCIFFISTQCYIKKSNEVKPKPLRSACFLILRVTDSPAICRRWMASLSGFPFKLTPLMARTLSPIWMAPVLQGEESRGDRDTRVYQTVPTGGSGNLSCCQCADWDGDKEAFCWRKRWDSHCLSSCLFQKLSPKWTTPEFTGLSRSATMSSVTSFSNNYLDPAAFHPSSPPSSPSHPLTSPPSPPSPLCQAFLGEARNYDGVKGLLGARDCDAQGPVVSLQLNCVDDGAWHLQLVYSTWKNSIATNNMMLGDLSSLLIYRKNAVY